MLSVLKAGLVLFLTQTYLSILGDNKKREVMHRGSRLYVQGTVKSQDVSLFAS